MGWVDGYDVSPPAPPSSSVSSFMLTDQITVKKNYDMLNMKQIQLPLEEDLSAFVLSLLIVLDNFVAT